MGRHRKRRTRRGLWTFGAVAGAVAGLTAQGTAHASEKQGVVDWTALLNCESSGDAKATNPDSSASGLFQILDSTWASNGGREFAKRAKDATEEQQFIIANRLFERRGLQPWDASKHCWKGRVKVVDGPAKQTGRHRAPEGTPAPSKQEPSKPQAPGKHRAHVVEDGDTLSSIAAENNIDRHALWNANRGAIGNPNMIHPGLRLTIPV